jgi:hypothetical protein
MSYNCNTKADFLAFAENLPTSEERNLGLLGLHPNVLLAKGRD